MKHSVKLILLMLLVTLGSAILVISPVKAIESSEINVTTNSPVIGRDGEVKTTIEERINAIETQGLEKVMQLQKKKEEANSKLSESAKKALTGAREKSCTARKTALTNKLTKKVTDSKKHKAVFDKILARVQEFHDSKKLTTTDYETLLSKAQAAGKNVDDSIAALSGIDVTVDCSKPGELAAKVTAFQTALGQTRQSLKDYRTAIKNLIVAVANSVKDSVAPSASPTPTENQ